MKYRIFVGALRSLVMFLFEISMLISCLPFDILCYPLIVSFFYYIAHSCTPLSSATQ